MQNAAERLLGLKLQEIQELAKDIIFGQLRLVIATMDIEEINTDRDKFLEAVSRNVEGELKKIGLRLINVNVTDITDESGYIDALGKEAAAKAINDAKKNCGRAGPRRLHRRGQRPPRPAHPGGPGRRLRHPGREHLQGGGGHVQRPAPREGGRGHPRSPPPPRRSPQPRPWRRPTPPSRTAEAARAQREKATQEADVIVKTEIDKQPPGAGGRGRGRADPPPRQGRGRRHPRQDAGRGPAAAQEILVKQADGLAADRGQPRAATPTTPCASCWPTRWRSSCSIQVDAVKNIKIDKVTVWDGGEQTGRQDRHRRALSPA